MTLYWFMLIVPIMMGLSPIKCDRQLFNLQWLVYGVSLVVIIGLRDQVGGDWWNYVQNFAKVSLSASSELIAKGYDIGYIAIHWFSLKFSNSIYITNTISAIFFVSGLMRLSKAMPIPWIALVVSIPYLVIAVSMGYTRQSIAIGIIMWGMVYITKNQSMYKYYFTILFATLFHKTALIMIPIGILYAVLKKEKFPYMEIIAASLFSVIVIYILVLDHIHVMLLHYINETQFESSGVFFRLSISAIAVAIFFYYRKSWSETFGDVEFWMIISVIIILMVPSAFFISTAVDRLALFLVPIQIVVFSRVPYLIKDVNQRTYFVVILLIGQISSLFVWLVFGTHAKNAWIPYKNLWF